jgi:RNA polymerase sigma-70 factor (ECF subfamily)
VDREHRFRVLYRDHQPDVLAYFLRRLNREDAVESTADVFCTLWRRLDNVPDDEDARLWLFGVAHNVFRNRRRSTRRWRRLIGRYRSAAQSDPTPSPDVVVIRRAEDDAVVEAMGRMRTGDREVLALRLWEEASFDEIAEVMGCSRHAAEQRYARALRRFRSVWDGTGHVPREGTRRSPRGQERIRET